MKIRFSFSVFSTKAPTYTQPLFPFFFWAVWASGNDVSEAEITALFPIRLLTDCCFQEKAARCPSGYPKAFRLLPKMAAARYVSSYSKLFGLLRKPCRRVSSPKSGNLFQPCGVLGLFLVLYAVQSHLAVQCGTPYAEQFCCQRAVAFRLFQRMDDLFPLHVV